MVQKYGFCSSNFPYGLGKYSAYGYLGPFGCVRYSSRSSVDSSRRGDSSNIMIVTVVSTTPDHWEDLKIRS